MHLPHKIPVNSYLFAVCLTALAVLLRWLLNPLLGGTLPMVTLWGAIAISAWFGGYRPALLALLLGYATSNYLFMPPQGSFRLDQITYIGFGAYLFTCTIIILLCESTRAADSRFRQKQDELQRHQEELRASEQSIRIVLESITDSFFSLDTTWSFIYVNPAAERLLNRPYGALIGKIIWEEFPDLIGSEIEALYHQVVKSQVADTLTTFYLPRNSWYSIRAYPSAEGLSVYFRDITESKKSEEALLRSEEQRRLALNSAELGAWNVDLATRSIHCDERFRIIFTGSTDPLSHDQAIAAIHEDDRERVRKAVAATINATLSMKTPVTYHEEYRVVHPDGKVRWVLAKGRANLGEDGLGPVSFDGTVSDITERKQKEELLHQQSTALAEADQRKNEFLATLAHELRNPLAPISNALKIMRLKSHDSSELEQARLLIERQVKQLVRLVDDLLDMSRISHGKLELRCDWIDLASVVKSAIETSRPLLDANELQIIVSLPSEPVYLHADMTRLAQVLLNLLNNAAKFTDRGGQVKLSAEWVAASERQEGSLPEQDSAMDAIAVTVSDTGIGIAADQLPRIFDAFNQVPGSLQRAQGGLGIGLMLVQRLVEMHGGVISAHSDGLGQGCQFILQLPALRSIPVSNMATEVDDALHLPSTKLRILVVDDNQDAATSLAMLLELLENETLVVNDGKAALEAAATYQPHAVVMDIGLPDISGYEVASRIREQAWGKNISLFALTGWGQQEDIRKSKEAGFDAHLVKPVNAADLIALLVGVENMSSKPNLPFNQSQSDTLA